MARLKKDKSCPTLPVINPNLQVSFYYRLQSLRNVYLHEALKNTIKKIDLETLNEELSKFVSAEALNRVASFGIRGEVFFPVPCLIQTNPYLLGFYRLLLGISQKECYTKGPFGRFKKLEEDGEIPERVKGHITALCKSLISSSEILVAKLDDIKLDIVNELQLLTLGPQLRGGENNRIGDTAIKEFRSLLERYLKTYVKEETERTLILENDSKRTVLIEFSNDPDVRIHEKLETHVRPLVSIEIKGGSDKSNIHNRIGEAEKSHQKAKNQGFFEFWTIVRVDVDINEAKRESPTTSHFFHLNHIGNRAHKEHKIFKEKLASLLGIRIK